MLVLFLARPIVDLGNLMQVTPFCFKLTFPVEKLRKLR